MSTNKDEINHSERAHALLSASGAKRWMTCPGSARLEEPYPNKSSVHAEEGTLAHEFSELELRKIMKLITVPEYKKTIKELRAHDLYTDDMEEHVDVYVTKVIEQLNKNEGSELVIEEKVDFSKYVPEGFGTCDAQIAAFKIRTLYTTDLKYGKGVQVYAEDNPQLKLYGLGALEKWRQPDGSFPFDTVILTIVQPRLNHVDSWSISVTDLLEWAEGELKEKASKAFKGGGELNAGDHCRFCRAAPRCRALMDFSLNAAKMDFALDPEDVKNSGLTDEEMEKLYIDIPTIEIWIKHVQNYMLDEALKGRKFENLKLVAGRSNRVWRDGNRVIQRLRDWVYPDSDILNYKVGGIGMIEKLLGKSQFNEILSDLVVKPEGKASLVHKSDNRPEMGLKSAQLDFAEPLDDLIDGNN